MYSLKIENTKHFNPDHITGQEFNPCKDLRKFKADIMILFMPNNTFSQNGKYISDKSGNLACSYSRE